MDRRVLLSLLSFGSLQGYWYLVDKVFCILSYFRKSSFMVYKIAYFLCAILSLNHSIALAEVLPERPIVVVIPSYNNKDLYKINLDSVALQNYRNFRVIYIDDCSTDGTGDLVWEYIRENQLEERFTLLQNKQNQGGLANYYMAAWMCEPSDIIVNLDGDDWLAHEEVLQTLNEVYSDPDVWMTYGQYVSYPEGYEGHCEALPDEVIQANGYRQYPWVTSHLRSYYAGLFQKIKVEDLLYGGQFYPVAWDLAMMLPMLEMSGWHSRFIPHVLYVYNEDSPLNDFLLRREFQLHCACVILGKQCYEPIENLFD